MSRAQRQPDFYIQYIQFYIQQWIYLKEIYTHKNLLIHFFRGATAPRGPVPPHCRGFTITLRHTSLGWNPLDEWSASRRDLTTHHSQNTHIHDPAGIGTRNPSKRTAADPRLRPRGHRDRPKFIHTHVEIYCSAKVPYIVFVTLHCHFTLWHCVV
jgi:hypothetical protein